MTPTIAGRIQSKLFLLLFIGPIWNAFIALFLQGGWFDNWVAILQVLLWTAVLGILWELLWHALQQFRWEKDWPILFGLLQFIPEGIVVYFLTAASFAGLVWVPAAGDLNPVGVGTGSFLWSFITTVLVTWTWINGPHRIFFIKWRFEGGRFV